MMEDYAKFFKAVDESAGFIKQRIKEVPKVAVVLTAGTGAFADGMEEQDELKFEEIPHFITARAEGHEGTMVFGKMFDKLLVAMQGRFHYYEGHHPSKIVFPYFVFKKLGVETLITTNAVGGVRYDLNPGDIMLINDHINMMGINPLIGLAAHKEDDQFTSMIRAYDPELTNLAKSVAKAQGVEIKEGIFAAVSGPSYETKAEVRMLRTLGADAVGMSTVPEVIVANFLKVKVLSVACVANAAADRAEDELSHQDVLKIMKETAPRIVDLLKGVVKEVVRK